MDLAHQMLQSMREDYKSEVLLETEVDNDPFVQFTKWFNRAKDDKRIFEPHGMLLATCSKEGLPSSRVVLLRGFDHRGFVFYTNYNRYITAHFYLLLAIFNHPSITTTITV